MDPYEYTHERCAGSGCAVGYTVLSGRLPVYPYPDVFCPACQLRVRVTTDYVNVRLVEHAR